MARFKVEVTVFVVPRRGPTPSTKQVEEGIVKLLHSDEMYATVDGPDKTFAAATFAVAGAEATAEALG